VAIAFDIDGVFKYGREWSPDGLLALQKATDAKIPFVFVTNGGGGLTEATYGEHLKEKVVASGSASGVTGDIELPSAQRMVLSYTPWATALAPTYADKRVLLIGDPKEKVLNVAAGYGLKNVTHYSDYAITHPNVNPFRSAKEAGTSHTAVDNKSVSSKMAASTKPPSAPKPADVEEPFAAILVMCDPYEWYEAVQVATDVLCSPTPLTLQYDTAAEAMPIHFSNPDFLSKFEHPYPRFAQGAFKVALRALYGARLRALRVPEETIDEKVGASFRQWGKPTEATFRFVEKRLRELTPDASLSGPVVGERFYMVGDNPSSDMEGARRANIFHRGQGTNVQWKGVLVRTGVYREGDETNGAAVVTDGVLQAVDWILEQEGLAADSGAAKRQKK